MTVSLPRSWGPELSLSTLFNSCIKEGLWPCDWKKGDWTPVYNKEDKNVKENYRPVTVLSCVNKVFERLLGNQVTTKCDDRLGDSLKAYRKHNSCETTLIGLVQDWKLARDYRLIVGILCLKPSIAYSHHGWSSTRKGKTCVHVYLLTVLAKLQESAILATNKYDSNLLQDNLKKYQTMNIWKKVWTSETKCVMLTARILWNQKIWSSGA